MKIKTYYEKLNNKSQDIFAKTLKNPKILSKGHSAASDLHKLSSVIPSADEAAMIQVVCAQIEGSCFALSLGLYRPALISLRLGFELGMGAIYFSSNKLAHREWKNGITDADLKWSMINNVDSGVLSQRFVKAFFPDLADIVDEYYSRAKLAYRCLSEYVHGNHGTWKTTGITLEYSERTEKIYSAQFDDVVEILKFAFCCRYLMELRQEELEEVQPVLFDTFMHITPIRTLFGGPKDIK